MYREEYNEPIKLDVVATYLSRYLKKGKLERSKKAKECIYKLSRQTAAMNRSGFKHETKNQVLDGAYTDVRARHLNN